MVEKIVITNKLENFCRTTNMDSFFRVLLISFLSDKINYIEKIIGTENALNMLDKYIYNLAHNLKSFIKLGTYHSIYAKYEYKTKQLKYYITNDYKKIDKIKLDKQEKRQLVIQEFKIMMYKEFEKIINIYSLNGKIVSNGFYIEDSYGRYPEYNGKFSDIIDIFSDVEACNICNINEKIKTYIDKDKNFFVYSEHFSQRNSEVIGYVKLWRKVLDNKLLYFAMNNPKKYSEKMIKDFNQKYEYVLNSNYNFILKNKDVFSLIENYLLHIRNRINAEYNIQYHQDISVIFELMNKKNGISKYIDYLLHSSNDKNKLEYKNIISIYIQ